MELFELFSYATTATYNNNNNNIPSLTYYLPSECCLWLSHDKCNETYLYSENIPSIPLNGNAHTYAHAQKKGAVIFSQI